MKAGWKVKPISEIADHVLGKMLDKAKNRGTLRPYLRNQNVRWFNFDLSDVAEMRFEDNEADRYSAVRGDALVCEGGYPGRAAVWDRDEPIFLQKAIHRVRFHEPERARWFVYYLSFCEADGSLRSHFTGSGIQHFTRQALAKFQLPIPPLEEQQQIVAVLDEAFEGLARARAHAEANLRDARELFASSVNFELSNLADCPRRRVSDVAKHSLGKMLDKAKNKGKPRPYLRNVNVRWFRVDTSDLLEMLIEDHEDERCSVSQGDLLICEGGYPGRAAIWDEEATIFFQKALHRVRFKDPVYAKLLMYHLFAEDYFGRLKDHFSGTGIQHFTGQTLGAFEMPFPSAALASSVVDQIERLQEQSNYLQAEYSAKLERLDALRQSFLQKAFAGELT